MTRWIGPMLFGALLGVIAWHLTVAAVPGALMTLAVRRVASVGGINRMTHAPIVTAKARTIVRPSPDLLYSSCPFDLANGPVLIDIVPVDAPYWSLSVFDAETNVAFVENNLGAGAAPLHVALLAARQAAPSGYRPVAMKPGRGVALLRILIDRQAPITAFDRARRRSSCRALG